MVVENRNVAASYEQGGDAERRTIRVRDVMGEFGLAVED
jgi:hypothetical protein